MDESDYKWLKFNSRNWGFLDEGRDLWWRCEPYSYRIEGKLIRSDPKWHVLTEVSATGENHDALYKARCGYKHKFSRILLEKPRVVKKKPVKAGLCLSCIRS